MKKLYTSFIVILFTTLSIQLTAQCPTDIVAVQVDCNTYNFHIAGASVGNVVWDFGDGGTITAGVEAAHSFEANGFYIVSAMYSGPDCPNQTFLILSVGAECPSGDDCPTQISANAGEDCGVMNFEIGSFVEGEAVTWFPGDETGAVETGHFFSHTYTESGNYSVCAFYTSPACPSGVELCTMIEVQSCVEEVCPTNITADALDCNSFVFHIQGAAEGNVLWNFGDDITEGSSINADHSFENNGVYTITAEYSGPGCPNGVTLNYTIEVSCDPEIVCPQEIWSGVGEGCGVMNFEIGSFVEGEAVTWFPGDETGAVQTGHFFSHTYAEPGSYAVCAFYTSPACPNGVELCTMIEVQSCEEEICPTHITADALDCNSFVFHIQGAAEGNVLWNFGDDITEGSSINADHSFENNGVYVVTAEFWGPNCLNGITLVYTVEVSCITEVVCPDAIWSGVGEDCGAMNFEIGSFVEGEAVTWFPGDETGAVQTGHFFSHTYAEPGSYQVCAFYTSPACPNGVELCTMIEVQSCEEESCPTHITADALDCNSFVFHIQGATEGNVMWNFGDDITEGSSINADHSFENNGVYVVTAEFWGPNCLNGITLTYTVEVSCGTVIECPQEIWSGAGIDCGVMNFEIGSFVEGEAVTWFPGDETGAVQTGHFFSHTYAEPGSYQVCAFYTSPACPNGVELCTMIEVQACEVECSDVVIGIDSYVNNGGTPWLTYGIHNFETNEFVSFGTIEYSENDPYHDFSTCLPDGCYVLTIDNNNPIQLGQGLNVFITMGNENLAENAQIIYQDNISFSMLFGVNSDCVLPSNCEASFIPQYTATAGHIEFTNNSVYNGPASFLWEYGNGETSDGQSGNIWYQQNGVYNVCLTVSTVNCEDTFCFPVSVQDFETACEQNSVMLAVTASYSSDITELVDMAISYEGIDINEWSLPMFSGFTTTVEMCIPDGCYELDMNTELPTNANVISANVTVNGESINALEFLNGATSSNMTFGLNSDCVTSIEKVKNTSWILYPNPASNILHVQTTDGSNLSALEVYDLLGQKILNTTSLAADIIHFDVSSLSPGIYFMRMMHDDSTQIQRFEIVK